MKSESDMINTYLEGSQAHHSKTEGIKLISNHMLKIAACLDTLPSHPRLSLDLSLAYQRQEATKHFVGIL